MQKSNEPAGNPMILQDIHRPQPLLMQSGNSVLPEGQYHYESEVNSMPLQQ
jgi:hypothetical protein